MEPSSTTYSTGTANVEFPGNSDFPFSPPLHVIITANFAVTGNQVDPEQLSSLIATTLKHVNTMFTSQNAKEWQEIATWALSRAIKERKAKRCYPCHSIRYHIYGRYSGRSTGPGCIDRRHRVLGLWSQ